EVSPRRVPMGAADEPTAVVDSRRDVRGIGALRIVDASIMPTVTSGNTNSRTLMIAEKAGAIVREDRGSARNWRHSPRLDEPTSGLPQSSHPHNLPWSSDDFCEVGSEYLGRRP